MTGRALPPGDPWARPAGVDDETVEAIGKVTEGFERLERARGALYEFHQQMGRADRLFGEGADELEAAGHGDWAERLRAEVVGRNVIDGRWTFQVVEEFDRTYYEPVRATERALCDALVGGIRHLHEAEMKEARRTPDHPLHRSRPPSPPG